MTRYECLEALAPLAGDALVVMAPGGVENEWLHLRPGPGTLRLMMGAVIPVCVGLTLALPRRRIIALDADGSVLINLGALCTVGALNPPNLAVIVMDNECYESIGGIPSHTALGTDLAAVARGTGIPHVVTTRTVEEFRAAAEAALTCQAAHCIVAKVRPGAKDLPVFAMDGVEMKYQFIRHIEATEGVLVLEGAPQRMPAHMVAR